MSTDTLSDRVSRGAALLDEKRPGWADDIDLDSLDLGECETCVIGQLCGDFDDGREFFKEEIEAFEDVLPFWEFVDCHGFAIKDTKLESYGDLTDLWRAVILARRKPQ